MQANLRRCRSPPQLDVNERKRQRRQLLAHVFKARGPIVCGVSVEAGYVRVGTSLCVPLRECIALCMVLPIEVNNKSIDLLSRRPRSLHQDQKHNRRGAAHGHSSVVSRFSLLHWTPVWRRVPTTPIRHRWLVVARTMLNGGHNGAE